MQLAENTGRKNYAKNRHLRTMAQLLSGYIFCIYANSTTTQCRISQGQRLCPATSIPDPVYGWDN